MNKTLLVLFILVLNLTSWARAPISEQQAIDIINEFQYENNFQLLSEEKSERSFRSCWTYEKVLQTEYPNMDAPLDVEFEMYMPNRTRLASEKVPLVIIIPPVGGINFLDRRVAKTLCSSKIASIIIANDFANIQYQANTALLPPEDHQKSFYRTGAAIKALMEVADQDDNVDPEKLGLFGVSLGGIVGSFIMSTQPRLSAGYFVVAGGDIPKILAVSEQTEIAKIRQRRMQERGFQTKEEYEEFLRDYVFFDPTDMYRTMLPETMKMVIATEDESVPTTSQELLFEAFGQPELQLIEKDHVAAIVSALFLQSRRRKIAEFFEEQFLAGNRRPRIFDFLNSLTIAIR